MDAGGEGVYTWCADWCVLLTYGLLTAVVCDLHSFLDFLLETAEHFVAITFVGISHSVTIQFMFKFYDKLYFCANYMKYSP